MIRVSVALAAYNGEKYIEQQIQSILKQLSNDDELIISLNPSSDNTEIIIREYEELDSRVKVFLCSRKGVIPNFENALNHCSGKYIILSDQDDIWLECKVEKMLQHLCEKKSLVVHNATFVDKDLQSMGYTLFEYRGMNKTEFGSFIKNSFQGCCMAFTRDILDICLPFPAKIPMHDQWIGMLALKYGNVSFLEESLIFYREHGENASPKGLSFKDKIIKRIQLLHALIVRYRLLKRRT